ncbi:hypothetical protein FY136_28585 (plasmid) [Agrobacterium tumefaciens]|uniref:hypothetical protein n=1 Tax=Agrobacterium tumefaciens TaxID=358 RepID=UPI0021CE7F04|nr:hypothetical protein [Agrobacterium tumefaciens]UXT53221.1 hypothetical protein FY136_28585 [Agrobacterium tumefaciens]
MTITYLNKRHQIGNSEMTISTANRKLIKSMIAQLEGLAAGDVAEVDFEGLATQIDAMPSDNHRLQVFLETASYHVGDIGNADEDERGDYIEAALSSLEELVDYRAPSKAKATSKAVTSGDVRIVMTDETTGVFRF